LFKLREHDVAPCNKIRVRAVDVVDMLFECTNFGVGEGHGGIEQLAGGVVHVKMLVYSEIY